MGGGASTSTRAFPPGPFDDPSEERPGTNEAASQILVGLTPRLPQATELCQLSATGLDRGELFVSMTPLLPQHIDVAGERG
jgi:hypothetical protein